MSDEHNVEDPFHDVPDHRGEPRPANREFFAVPPVELGHLQSAETTLKAGAHEWSPMSRFVLIATPLALSALCLVMALGGGGSTDNFGSYMLACIVTFIFALVAWWLTRFRHVCTFVGENGIARYTLRGRRDAEPRQMLLMFPEVAELHTRKTNQFLNGVYTGTNYAFRWDAPSGRRMLQLKGSYRGLKKPPKAKSPFHFAASAETAWSTHYLQRAQAQLEAEGSIAFPVDKHRVVRVGPGFLEFHFGGEPVRVTHDDIAKVTLGGGTFTFKHKDARWFSSEGKYRFQYGSMANALVFLMALDHFMGYRWN